MLTFGSVEDTITDTRSRVADDIVRALHQVHDELLVRLDQTVVEDRNGERKRRLPRGHGEQAARWVVVGPGLGVPAEGDVHLQLVGEGAVEPDRELRGWPWLEPLRRLPAVMVTTGTRGVRARAGDGDGRGVHRSDRVGRGRRQADHDVPVGLDHRAGLRADREGGGRVPCGECDDRRERHVVGVGRRRATDGETNLRGVDGAPGRPVTVMVADCPCCTVVEPVRVSCGRAWDTMVVVAELGDPTS